MQIKMRLLAGAAIGLLAATSLATTADAAPKHRAAKSSTASLEAQVKELQAQVESLQQTLAAQAQAQQQTQAQVQQAQTTAQTAADQARAAQTAAAQQIETIPAQVKTAVAANKPKPGWEGSTSVNGRMYYDITHIENKSNTSKVTPTGTGFDIKRFYVGIDHKFNDVFSANITTDVQYLSADSLTQVYIKKAYLQAKLNDLFTVRLGSADLPWVPFAEDVYGYRFVENTIADRTKFATSADWGAHVLGKYGIFSYQVSVINGAGYKNPVRSKSVDIEGRVSANYQGFTVGVGGYNGKLGKDVQGGVATPHTATRFDALAAYVQPRYRLGVEYFQANDYNNVTSVASDKADGYSVFGNVNFTPKVSVFGRWDHVKPSKKVNPRLENTYYNVGLNFEPVKIVDFALVYKHDNVEHGLLTDSNGTIGNALIATGKGDYDEVGLFGQLRW